MTTMNISLPEALKAFVDEQVTRHQYSSTSEYVRELIRRDLDRSELRELLLAGARSEPAADADDELMESLRARARGNAGG